MSSVKLNVGGVVFETSKSTLTRFDGFFKTMLETDIPISRNAENCIFIDRDPTHFRYILNFMRDGSVDLPDFVTAVKELSKEANYYLLEGLMELCQQKLEPIVMVNQLGLPTQCFVLQTYEQVLSLTENPEKPILIIYYTVDSVGRLLKPWNFSVLKLSEKYCTQLDIYLKKSEIVEFETRGIDQGWQFAIHYKEHCWTKISPDGDRFSGMLEEAIQEFFEWKRKL